MKYDSVLQELAFLKNKKHADGMRRFGIAPKTKVYGIPIPKLRKIAKAMGKNHELALQLWKTGIHEARILAGFIDDPEEITEKQFDHWVKDFDSWDVVDSVCSSLFEKTRFVTKKIFSLAKRKEEFMKRTAFSLMAYLAVHDKKAKDTYFLAFFPLIKREARDSRNFVKKAVNWALRQIGKRNRNLHKKSLHLARKISKIDSKSAQWIARNALRELESKKVIQKWRTL